MRDPDLLRPLRQGLGLPIEREAAIVESIPPLLFFRRPAAVIRVVALAVANALDGQPRWPGRHIVHEIRERMPPLANSDACSTVSAI